MEVNRAFHLPHQGAATGVRVTLFEQLTSEVLQLGDGQGEVACEISLPDAGGASPSKLKLLVRQGAAKRAPLGEDAIGDAAEYLERHKLQQRIQGLIQRVLKAQPADPYRFMVDCLRNSDSARDACGGAATPPSPMLSELLRSVPGLAVAPAGEAKTEAPAGAPLVPRPPGGAPPASPSFRKARAQAASGQPQAPEEPPAAQRGLARQASRGFIDEVLATPRISLAASDSVRAGVHESVARGCVDGILGRARERVLDEFLRSQDTRVQARAACCDVYRRASVLLHPVYRSAVTRWATRALMRSAANIIGDDMEMRRACFVNNDPHRRMSVPQPIVFLSSEHSGWSTWLSSGRA